MDMTGVIGKKVDIELIDGKKFSGYVMEVTDAEDSDIGEESIDLSPIGEVFAYTLPTREIKSVIVDTRYKELDFAI